MAGNPARTGGYWLAQKPADPQPSRFLPIGSLQSSAARSRAARTPHPNVPPHLLPSSKRREGFLIQPVKAVDNASTRFDELDVPRFLTYCSPNLNSK